MPLPATIPAAILETILIRLAALFLTGAGNDHAAARDAAARMLEAYHPQTEDELRLAANIVSFSFQALEALAQAAAPDLPITRILRLRGGAVTLSRESAKAERRLLQLQKSRHQPAQEQAVQAHPEPIQPAPKVEQAVALVQDTARVTIAAKAKNLTWTQAYAERQRETRIAASLKRAEAKFGTQASAAPPQSVIPPQHAVAQAT